MELNTIERLSGSVTLETTGTSQQVCDQILGEIRTSNILKRIDNHTLGIYVISPNAGMHESVAFWKQALEQGPGFMSPQNFPWTLSNGPATYLARQLDAHGPNVTIVGDWINPILPCVRHDIQSGKCRNALVAFINFSNQHQGYFIVFTVSPQTSLQYECIGSDTDDHGFLR